MTAKAPNPGPPVNAKKPLPPPPPPPRGDTIAPRQIHVTITKEQKALAEQIAGWITPKIPWQEVARMCLSDGLFVARWAVTDSGCDTPEKLAQRMAMNSPDNPAIHFTYKPTNRTEKGTKP